MISIWEKESLLSYDAIVVGAGITGLSTAASLKELSPQLNILVLEKGTLPAGASTRNAGFACFGSTSELLEDIDHLGEDGMQKLVEKRWLGLQKTKDRLGANEIGFEPCGGYELFRASDPLEDEVIPRLNHLLKDIVGHEVFMPCSQELKSLGFKHIKHLIFNKYEGAIHTGKMMNALWSYCQSLGIRIITGTPVISIDSSSGAVHTDTFTFESKAIAVCTNAFSGNLLQNIDLKPGRGMVMLIKPERPINYTGTFHYDRGYYYFRHFEQKIIFGGGRNLDDETESTVEFGLNPKIRKRLIHDLENLILPAQSYEIEMEWSGIMAFGPTKAPVIQQVDHHLFAGVRLGGMGVAIGSMVGEELAELIIKTYF